MKQVEVGHGDKCIFLSLFEKKANGRSYIQVVIKYMDHIPQMWDGVARV